MVQMGRGEVSHSLKSPLTAEGGQASDIRVAQLSDSPRRLACANGFLCAPHLHQPSSHHTSSLGDNHGGGPGTVPEKWRLPGVDWRLGIADTTQDSLCRCSPGARRQELLCNLPAFKLIVYGGRCHPTGTVARVPVTIHISAEATSDQPKRLFVIVGDPCARESSPGWKQRMKHAGIP